jgi:hypothetical protein
MSARVVVACVARAAAGGALSILGIMAAQCAIRLHSERLHLRRASVAE